MTPFRWLLSSLLALSASVSLFSSETVPDVSSTVKPAAEPIAASKWTIKNRASAYVTQAAVDNADISNDPKIGGQISSWAYSVSFEHSSQYAGETIGLENTLLLIFGQQETRGYDEFGERLIIRSEIEDQIKIDLLQTYNVFSKPHEVYTSESFETAFTGQDPNEIPADDETDYLHPQLLKLAFGYRTELATDLLARFGLRYQDVIDDETSDPVTGVEIIFDYTRQFTERCDYVGRFEIFSELSDIKHIAYRFENKLNCKIMSALTLELSWLFYYETNPNDIPAGKEEFYNSLSWMQTAKLGLVVEF
ncbi:MAG: DUF481 domain-containing protein [Planctomycetota bacterium]